MAEHGVAALSHPPSGERVRTGPADPSGAWDQDHPPSTETTTQESGLRENRTSRLSERTEEGRKPDLLPLYSRSSNVRMLVRLVLSARARSHSLRLRAGHGRSGLTRDPARCWSTSDPLGHSGQRTSRVRLKAGCSLAGICGNGVG